MDISATTQPRSDQQNFDDYAAGPRTVTVAEVRAGSDEQPVEVHLVEYPGRPYKPSKSMRRVLIAAWGAEASAWHGRRMTLVGDPSVKFGGVALGGIKIAALSHLDSRLSVSLTVTRGKRAPHSVDPLPEVAPAPTTAQVAASTDEAELKAWWTDNPALRDQINARVTDLRNEPDAPAEPAAVAAQDAQTGGAS